MAVSASAVRVAHAPSIGFLIMMCLISMSGGALSVFIGTSARPFEHRHFMMPLRRGTCVLHGRPLFPFRAHYLRSACFASHKVLS